MRKARKVLVVGFVLNEEPSYIAGVEMLRCCSGLAESDDPSGIDRATDGRTF